MRKTASSDAEGWPRMQLHYLWNQWFNTGKGRPRNDIRHFQATVSPKSYLDRSFFSDMLKMYVRLSANHKVLRGKSRRRHNLCCARQGKSESLDKYIGRTRASIDSLPMIVFRNISIYWMDMHIMPSLTRNSTWLCIRSATPMHNSLRVRALNCELRIHIHQPREWKMPLIE